MKGKNQLVLKKIYIIWLLLHSVCWIIHGY